MKTTANIGPVSHIAFFRSSGNLTYTPVKPLGRLPWFLTASQALVDQLRGRRDNRMEDSGSIKSGWDYQDRLGSKASNQDTELEMAMPMNPAREKVLRKM
jgi:AGZA family xanthine/uracil permease-like MFS transporter